jgi:phosphohistidine swiveling domain-containing protein
VSFAVRSSATKEDLPGRSAAGLFLSRMDVRLQSVPEAVRAVRDSGHSPQVKLYCAGEVAVAALIQPMVAAARLGVLYLDLDVPGSAVCEERPAGAPEWTDATARPLPPGDTSPLAVGAQKLAALLRNENPAQSAVYVEYAVEPDGGLMFLQVRPAPPATPREQWPALGAGEDTEALVYVHDQEHNPDPLSRAQSGLVEGVSDLVPTLRQRVYRGYLYYADAPGAAAAKGSGAEVAELGAHYACAIAPACEALLSPLERQLAESDGALSPRLLRDPALAPLSLAAAWAAYRGVYALYVTKLGPALRQARHRLDELLQKNLGESLPQQGALLAAAADASMERLQQLWELGRAGAKEPLLRAYLKRYGAFAACWDIAVPCDDEQPERIRAMALRLAAETHPSQSPRELQKASEASYEAAMAELFARLPSAAQKELGALLPQARTAQRIAEEDDALFFRAQRLMRWALLRRGALLAQAGRLDRASAIFDLPWQLHGSLLDEFAPESFAPDLDLQRLATEGARERAAAQALVPPSRLVGGRPLFAPPCAEVLFGYGVTSRLGEPVRGRARVIRTLFPAEPPVERGEDRILVLPALLPSWALEVFWARALVTDSGGALSHGAILARERGLPAVVGTRVATRTIRDGQELWVDAARGRVYLIP